MPTPLAVGIDLGTTNSMVAILEGGRPVVLPNAEGSSFTPSVVGLTPDDELVVGELAVQLSRIHPDRVAYSVKRLMGGDQTITLGGRTWLPQEVSARILQKIVRDAEAACGCPVPSAVVTVPAYFDDAARQATLDAARIAGIEVLRLVNEPTAAALAYGLGSEGAATVLVFDLGGGTCDASVLSIAGGVFEVRSTCGNVTLGGNDWDERLAGLLLEKAFGSQGEAMRQDAGAWRRVLEQAETAKVALSSQDETSVNVTSLDTAAPVEVIVTRTQFEAATADLLDDCRALFVTALADAGLPLAGLDHVVLVGGASRMPAVRQMLRTVTGREPQIGIDPERVVAVGAALQAGVLLGERSGLLLVDVTPLSLGIETHGGVMTPLIERNTTIPTRHTKVFTTAEDDQTSVEIHVLQGERPLASQNRSMGILELTGIMRMARGEPQIEVVFAIDADGVVHVSAKDLLTGAEQSLTMVGTSALAPEVIEELILEAERHADEDRRRRDESGARNEAELALYQTEKLLLEHGDRIGGLARELEAVADDLAIALDADDVDAIRAAHKALLGALQSAAADERGSRE
ncbi:MAG: molecular chaperone DnaK [Actinomycetes bacterium]